MNDSKQHVALASWLTAVWDEEERLAQTATPGPWAYIGRNYIETGPIEIDVADWGPERHEGLKISTQQDVRAYRYADVAFIAANNPASVLARIAADRKILELHSRDNGRCDSCYTDVSADWGEIYFGRCEPYCPTVLALASPYKGREGWQEEWDHE